MKKKIFNIEDHGAIGDGKTDCTKAFNDIIRELKTLDGKKSIVFGTGVFLISDILEITGIDDLTIQGNGVSTILLQNSAKKGCIWIDHCNDMKLSGISFDMTQLPFCQGIVRKTGDFFVEIETSGDFSDKFAQPWFFEKILNIASIIKYSGEDEYYLQDFAWYKNCERISENRWKVAIVDDGWLCHSGISEGDGMYFLSRGGSKDTVFKASGCKNIIMENLTAYAGSSLTMKLYGNENICVRNLSVRKKHGRMISTNADGIHASDNRGKFEISGCFFEGMADDGINVHNCGCDIKEVISDTEIRLPSNFTGRKGDHIQIIDLHSSHRVKGESEIISRLKTDDGIKITLDQPIIEMTSGRSTLKINDSIIMNIKGDHAYVHESCGRLHIHDCYFGHYRGRGILAHSNALIENNIFDNDSASAIQITMDSVWPEGPVPKDIMIRNNKFIAGSNIPGQPVVFATWISQDGYMRNISIIDNHFSGKYSSNPIVSLNCDNIEISGNVFPDFTPHAKNIDDIDDCMILRKINPLCMQNGLWIFEDNLCGRNFFEKSGFSHDGAIKEINLGKPVNLYHYTKTINC